MNAMLPSAVIVLFLPVSSLLGTVQAAGRTPTVAQWIEQLGSDKYATREQAAQRLQALGLKALPVLRQAEKHPDLEIRRRVQRLIPLIQIAAALEPKRVTLRLAHQPVSVALREIEKQTGYKLTAEGTNETKCNFTMEKATFWEAIERIRRQTGQSAFVKPLENLLQLEQKGERTPLVFLSGPFHLEAQSLHEDRDIIFREAGNGKDIGKRDHLLRLTVAVQAEPRFIMLDVDKAKVDVAFDENGKPLQAPAIDNRQQARRHLMKILQDCPANSSEVFLKRSSAQARTIRLLRGSIPVQLVVERKRVLVAENVLALKGSKFRLGDAVLEITRAELQKNGDFHLHIKIPPPEIELERWHGRVHLEDAKGNSYSPNGIGSNRWGNHKAEIYLSYPPSKKFGPPSKLFIEDWVIVTHSLPFEFKEIPLP